MIGIIKAIKVKFWKEQLERRDKEIWWELRKPSGNNWWTLKCSAVRESLQHLENGTTRIELNGSLLLSTMPSTLVSQELSWELLTPYWQSSATDGNSTLPIKEVSPLKTPCCLRTEKSEDATSSKLLPDRSNNYSWILG